VAPGQPESRDIPQLPVRPRPAQPPGREPLRRGPAEPVRRGRARATKPADPEAAASGPA